jgi:hypothetical protein
MITKTSDLAEYFRDHVGPVFCTPSKVLLHRYPQLEDMLGMVVPFRSGEQQNLISVDWSGDKAYEGACLIYDFMSDDNVLHQLDELNIIKPGNDIPQLADDRWVGYDWTPSKRGDIVAISHHMLSNGHSSQQNVYSQLDQMIGVVTDRCETNKEQLMVTFSKDTWSKIINVPVQLLVKLPPLFKPKGSKVNANMSNKAAEFKVGDVVKVSPSFSEDNYIGLIGIVKEVMFDQNGTLFQPYSYLVNLDTLPNRCLALTEGEGSLDLSVTWRIKECHLDEWDEKVSDKPHLSQFRANNNRDVVYVPQKKKLATVIMKTGARKSVGQGLELEVKVLQEDEKMSISCRDVDYNWEPDVLLSTLSDSVLCLGVEEDNRNPNEIDTRAYIYLFNNHSDVGKRVEQRVLLGSVKTRKAILKKFGRAIMSGKLTHPWQVHRYLRPDSLGLFFSLFKAGEYIKEVGLFANAD